MAKSRHKKVRFVFRSHDDKNPFLSRGEMNAASELGVEEPKGRFNGLSIDEVRAKYPIPKEYIFYRTMIRRIDEARKGGKKVYAAEKLPLSIRGLFWKRQLKNLLEELSVQEELMGDDPTVKNIASYFGTRAKFYRLRHRIIRKNIAGRLKGDGRMLFVLGSEHSLLSRELQQEGIESERPIKPTHFTWDSIVIRRLLHKKKPTISNADYKRAFLNDLFWYGGKKLTKNNSLGFNEREMREIDDVSFYYITRLTEKQLDHFIDLYRKVWRSSGNITHTSFFVASLIMSHGSLKPQTWKGALDEARKNSFFPRKRAATEEYRKRIAG